MVPEISQQIDSGKTKTIFSVSNQPSLVIIRNRDDITALDDPKLTQVLPGKGIAATSTTCRVFELLRAAGIPVAFQKQLSPTDFLATRCQMVPLEVVVRRYAFGSALKRCPWLLQGHSIAEPPRFEHPVVEFFLKTTGGQLILSNGVVALSGLKPESGEEDPLIAKPLERPWVLLHPKQILNTPESSLKLTVDPFQILSPQFKDYVTQMRDIAESVFLILEQAWQQVGGYKLIDMKVEFGFNGIKILLADVIDSDSWRLWTPDGQDVSKQTFRDGGALETVLRNYQQVAKLAAQLKIAA